MYHIKIKLILKNDIEILGIAVTTHYNNEKQECVMINTDTGNVDIVLTQIDTMTALKSNPHFETVSF